MMAICESDRGIADERHAPPTCASAAPDGPGRLATEPVIAGEMLAALPVGAEADGPAALGDDGARVPTQAVTRIATIAPDTRLRRTHDRLTASA